MLSLNCADSVVRYPWIPLRKNDIPCASGRSNHELEGQLPASLSDNSSLETDKGAIDARNGDGNGANTPSEESNAISTRSDEESSTDLPQSPPAPAGPLSLPKAPWNIGTTITVMACWLICFYIAAYDIVPFLLKLMGYGTAAAAAQPAVQALRHLLLDATQLTMTLLLLRQALRSYSPRSLGLFSVKLRPFRSWVPSVIVGIAAFPFVDLIHKQMVNILSPSNASPVSNAAFVGGATWEVRATWFLVLAICAPLWEEIMFRGFLLPSLARYLEPTWAVAASSLVFATVHFTKEGFVPLLLLGGVFGAAYLKTLNLLPAVILHSLWNICLLTQILMTG